MPVGRWCLAVGLAEPDQGSYALLRFSLDEQCMRVLLNGLTTERAVSRDGGALQQPLASRLKLTLVAQLLEQRLPLAQILDLRVGDVLPIHLQATEVLVKDARLFTATVAEHKARLWLTAFEPI
jgi:flagellar motor switch protein FliM